MTNDKRSDFDGCHTCRMTRDAQGEAGTWKTFRLRCGFIAKWFDGEPVRFGCLDRLIVRPPDKSFGIVDSVSGIFCAVGAGLTSDEKCWDGMI